MLIELHIIQNFAPSNLNRDDTNSPKDCTFGGHRRARISSQCLKRSIRTHPAFEQAVKDSRGVRTKQLVEEIAKRLEKDGRDREEATKVAAATVEAAGYKLDEKSRSRTSVLLFLSPGEIDGYARIIGENYDALRSATIAEQEKKKPGTITLDKSIKKAIEDLGSRADAADIALFGRMVAETKNMNVEAACQVAHAISTHPVDVEMDFYTAVDDLQPKEDTGAGMMGVIEFNSACFYRYAVLDTDQLEKNLHGDKQSARAAALGFVEAAVKAIPSGKQNSMAAHNPPSYIRLRVRDGGSPWSLANAFANPAPVSAQKSDLPAVSIEKLEQFDQDLQAMYGSGGIDLDRRASTYADHRDGSLAELLQALSEKLS